MILRNCSIEELISRSKDNILVCFGAGSFFSDMLKLQADSGIKDKIAFIVDNNPKLVNSEIEVQDKIYKVYSVNGLKKYLADKLNILITTMWFKEVIEQLDSISELNNANVYVFPIIQALDKKVEIEYKKGTIMTIPKVIHYCWFGKTPLPDSAKFCINSWKKYCPDYEIIEWNESNYDVDKIRYTKEAYNCQEYAFVSDYARLDVVNQYGGIYMDIDVEVIKNLDDLLYNEAYCGFAHSSPRINTGCGFGAKKGFHILREWMEPYENEGFILGDGSLNKKLCTVYQTDVLKRKNFKDNGKFQRVEGLVCFPQEFFNPIDCLTGIESITDNTYSIHYNTLLWNISLKGVRSETKLAMDGILKRMEETEKCMVN